VGEIDADEMINSLYPERDIERRELMFRMNQAIAMLPRQCQLVFKLIKEDGMKYKEVAEILHISPRTVQTQLFRAIAKLRVALRPYLGNRSGRSVPIWLPIIFLLGLYA
jgi:RNA polymerase sigma-70 factor (ECF subfamily)